MFSYCCYPLLIFNFKSHIKPLQTIAEIVQLIFTSAMGEILDPFHKQFRDL